MVLLGIFQVFFYYKIFILVVVVGKSKADMEMLKREGTREV